LRTILRIIDNIDDKGDNIRYHSGGSVVTIINYKNSCGHINFTPRFELGIQNVFVNLTL